MGRLKKKGKSGIATQFISRTRAVRKLQLSLADFQRLCIIKGVYPREPPNMKKAGGGNRAVRTYYHTKDIMFLLHEPLIHKFREFKIFTRKLKTAVAKKDASKEQRLLESKPVPNLNHIVKERYPSFVDALRDLDDALCMLFLFAQMPQSHKVKNERITKCKILVDEFMQYVIRSHALRKVFLSIKGIYYQAEIMGQPVTWIAPYKFAMDTPTDVDFRIMDTFLHFYTTLGGFVNCRLYAMLNLRYPPKVDALRAKADAGLSALMLEAKDGSTTAGGGAAAAKPGKKQKKLKAAAAKRAVAAVNVASAEAEDDEEEEEEEDSDGEEEAAEDSAADGGSAGKGKGAGKGASLDYFPDQIEGGDATVAEMADAKRAMSESAKFERLFEGCWFYLNREVPRHSLEFVIRSFGGHVSWQGLGGEGGGPYGEDDKRITHQIVDRPKLTGTMRPERHYVQPQWVYDAVNSRTVLPTAAYTIGAALPPHLSPFEVEDKDGYTPPEAAAVAITEEAATANSFLGSGADDLDNEDEAGTYEAELEEEAKGLPINEKAVEKKKKKKAVAKQQRAKEAVSEHKELAKSLMSKKNKKLYEQIMYGKAKKAAVSDKLKAKRKAHDDARDTTKKSKKKKTAK